MGGGFSKANSVWFQSDKPAYFDGDVVMGLVCLNVTDAVEITTIDCQLRGFEKTHWTETHTHGSGSNSHTTTEYHGATVAFLDVTHPLAGAHRRLEPGQYQWQIAFALPQGVPSSFLISSGGTKVEVSYSVDIVFHTPGKFSSAIRSSQPLMVHQRLQAPPMTVDQTAEQVLMSCCCCSRGLVKAHVRVERDRYQPGESAEVLLEIDNRSKLPIKAIELGLKHEVVARERMGGVGHRKIMHWENNKAKHPGVQPFTVLQGSMARRLQLCVPAELCMQPSMRGQLITCDYFAKIRLVVGSCVEDMKLKVPFIVTAPQPQATEEAPFFSEPPAFWKPTEIQPPEAISVPTAPALPAELLKPDASFWVRSMSHDGRPDSPPLGAAAAAANDDTSKFPVV